MDRTDYKILSKIVSESRGLIFSPNILTETSNLIDWMKDPAKSEILQTLKDMIHDNEEIYVDSKISSNRLEYFRLGLTDSVLLALAERGSSLLTLDHHLYIAAVKSRYDAINYNHIRERRPDFH